MTNEMIHQIREAIRIRGERPAAEQIEDMIARGAIDREGNVLLRGPREIWREQFGYEIDAPSGLPCHPSEGLPGDLRAIDAAD